MTSAFKSLLSCQYFSSSLLLNLQQMRKRASANWFTNKLSKKDIQQYQLLPALELWKCQLYRFQLCNNLPQKRHNFFLVVFFRENTLTCLFRDCCSIYGYIMPCVRELVDIQWSEVASTYQSGSRHWFAKYSRKKVESTYIHSI